MGKKLVIFILLLLLCPTTLFAKSIDYEKARKCYLEEASPKGSKRTNWEKCINLFIESAEGVDKEAGLYSAARLNKEAYYRFNNSSNRDEAVRLYNEVITNFPKGNLAPDALYRVACMRQDDYKDFEKAKKAFNYLIENYKDSRLVSSSKERLIQIAEIEKTSVSKKTPEAIAVATQPTTTSQIKFKGGEATRQTPATITWTKGDSEQFVSFNFISDRNINYNYYSEPEGLRTKSPPKLVIEFPHTNLANGLAKKVPIDSEFVKNLKFKENFISNRLTIIFEMDKKSKFTVKKINKDIVVKIGNVEAEQNPTKSSAPAVSSSQKTNKTIKIMIDPGHGGDDTGAIGPRGTQEKDIVLSMAKNLKRDLEKQLNAEVKLTRTKDEYLTLDQRNRIAERWRADLFISLHVNAAPNKEARGVETYYLNNTTNKASIKLAERENKYSGKSLKDVDKIVLTMLQNYNAGESRDLANSIQSSIVKSLSSRYGNIEDKGVKSALFYVLVGAKCPGVIVEASFISNKDEEKRLRQKEYQSKISSGIVTGIKDFLSRNPTDDV